MVLFDGSIPILQVDAGVRFRHRKLIHGLHWHQLLFPRRSFVQGAVCFLSFCAYRFRKYTSFVAAMRCTSLLLLLLLLLLLRGGFLTYPACMFLHIGRRRRVLVWELVVSVGVCGHRRDHRLGGRGGALHADSVFGLRPQPDGRDLPRGGAGNQPTV